MELLISKLKSDINSNIDSLIFVGENSDGKTKLLHELAKTYNNEQCIYIPEHIKDLKIDLNDVEKDYILKPIKEIISERFSTSNDELKDIIPYILSKDVADPIFDFFKTKLKFKLEFEEHPGAVNSSKLVKIKRNGKSKSEVLSSTGFKLMIRISSEIYLYLKSFNPDKTTYILVDEIDDKLYWNNRSIFFKELFIFLKEKFRNIKFIFSTNMPESLYSLPKEGKFKIIKIFQDENSIINYKSYDASDFLTTQSIDKVIFDKTSSFIDKSDNRKKLEEIYMTCLKCNSMKKCNMCEITKTNIFYLTTKEKILYHSIMELRN